MKIKYLCGFCLFIAITPIVINYILTRDVVCNYNVAGSGKDWISFYGSFLGSVLSTCIAYYVLLKTIEHEKRENMKRQKRQDLEWLREDLSNRISNLEITDVFRVFLYLPDIDIQKEIERLTNLLYDYKAKSNSSMLKYGLNDKDERCKEFFDVYNALICDVCCEINELRSILISFQHSSNKGIFMDRLPEIKEKMKTLNERPQFVFEKAKAYYIAKKNELDAIDK